MYLILTLNQTYPDYDFSQLRAHHFRKEAGFAKAEEVIDTCLLDVGKVGGWPGRVWLLELSADGGGGCLVKELAAGGRVGGAGRCHGRGGQRDACRLGAGKVGG